MRFIFLFNFFILFKFILAVVVFFATRNFFGAIIGFAIGTVIDNYRKLAKMVEPTLAKDLVLLMMHSIFTNNVQRPMILVQ